MTGKAKWGTCLTWRSALVAFRQNAPPRPSTRSRPQSFLTVLDDVMRRENVGRCQGLEISVACALMAHIKIPFERKRTDRKTRVRTHYWQNNRSVVRYIYRTVVPWKLHTIGRLPLSTVHILVYGAFFMHTHTAHAHTAHTHTTYIQKQQTKQSYNKL